MPQVTLYIRNEDLEKWKQLQDKSEAVHRMLNNVTTKQPELVEDEEESDFSGYAYDPATNLIYDRETQEQVPGKVDGNGKIVAIY